MATAAEIAAGVAKFGNKSGYSDAAWWAAFNSSGPPTAEQNKILFYDQAAKMGYDKPAADAFYTANKSLVDGDSNVASLAFQQVQETGVSATDAVAKIESDRVALEIAGQPERDRIEAERQAAFNARRGGNSVSSGGFLGLIPGGSEGFNAAINSPLGGVNVPGTNNEFGNTVQNTYDGINTVATTAAAAQAIATGGYYGGLWGGTGGSAAGDAAVPGIGQSSPAPGATSIAPTGVTSTTLPAAGLPAPTPAGAGGFFENGNWIPTAIGTGLNLYGMSQTNNAIDDAQDGANAATNAATAENRRQFDIGQENLAPWLSAGKTALGASLNLQGLSGDPTSSLAALQASPGYQFRLKQGQEGLDASSAARGGMGSGKALTAAAGWNQEFASNEYGNRLNQLAGLSNTGQTTGTTMANQGANFANSQGNLLTNNANFQGAAGISGANANNNGLYNLANIGLNAYNYNRERQ